MNGLAQAIVALINSKPVSPRVDELEGLIRQHLPAAASAASAELHLFDPSCLDATLPPLCQSAMSLGPRKSVKELRELADYAGPVGAVVYAHPVLLVDPRDGQRSIAGGLMNPPRLYIGWHDDEQDCIVFSHVWAWGAVRAVAPQQYTAIVRVKTSLTQTMP